MAGKGDKRRPEDAQAYRDNHDRIFGKKVKEEEEPSDEDFYVYCDVCGYDWEKDDPCPFH
tara:strand:+ start:16173 stop:16352 length:180 start_codon:yes stop_codon:yes gene_type:complete